MHGPTPVSRTTPCFDEAFCTAQGRRRLSDSASVASRALGKASWRILPLVGLGYLFSYLDRLNVSFAATQMNADLKFSATVYGLGSGFFFLTYALLEIPSGMVMPRIGARRWMARIMITWGLISAGMMFVRTPIQFYIMRLLLGAAEAGFWPTCIYYLAYWYPAAHRGRAMSRFYCFGGMTNIVGGALAGWLLGLDGVAGLRGWQWLFLLEGLPTVLLGLAILWLLPDRPATSRWLADDERAWIVDELAAENVRLTAGKEPHPLRALQDPLVLHLAAIACLTIGGYMAFVMIAPQVLMTGTGMNVGHVGYLIGCGGAMTVIGMLASGWHSDRAGDRFGHLIGSMLLVAAAFAAMAYATTPAILITAYLAMCFFWPAVTLSTNLVSTEVVPCRMVAVAVAVINTLAQLGAFVVPVIWGISKDSTGSYHLGLTMIPLLFIASAGLAIHLRRQIRLKWLAVVPVIVPA
jgi:ACS family tartrate transporter-like MFS transporter